MRNYSGGILIIAAAYQRVTDEPKAARQFNVRSASGNAAIYLSADGLTDCGFITATEARQFLGTSPDAVYFRGTAGNTLYWDVSE
jgi:hypothetical protein